MSRCRPIPSPSAICCVARTSSRSFRRVFRRPHSCSATGWGQKASASIVAGTRLDTTNRRTILTSRSTGRRLRTSTGFSTLLPPASLTSRTPQRGNREVRFVLRHPEKSPSRRLPQTIALHSRESIISKLLKNGSARSPHIRAAYRQLPLTSR
jgi:hypothetical protein